MSNEIKSYQDNPRIWTDEQKEKLRTNLRELGDLSGIVHDLNSNQIVSGNFRSEIFDINDCEIRITVTYDTPDTQGTVAWGFVIWEGKQYNYRQVRWTKEQCDKACITANSLGGDWAYAILQLKWPSDLLLECDLQIPISEVIPTDLVREEKAKPASMKITFASVEQFESARSKIEELLKEYEGAFFSVSCGEI